MLHAVQGRARAEARVRGHAEREPPQPLDGSLEAPQDVEGAAPLGARSERRHLRAERQQHVAQEDRFWEAGS